MDEVRPSCVPLKHNVVTVHDWGALKIGGQRISDPELGEMEK